MKNLFVLAALVLGVAWARGQSFNCDLSINSDPAIGGGVPSDGFAAAGQAGRWNYVDVISDAFNLRSLSGAQTDVDVLIDSFSPSISGGGFRNLTNTGDYARLLNDCGNIDMPWRSWTFHGLENGTYRCITYAVKPFPEYTEAYISVNGGPIAMTAGIMPGNQLILGTTHVIQETVVTDGTLEIFVSRNPNGNIANVNGFQISAVPEPSSIIYTIFATILYSRRRRRL